MRPAILNILYTVSLGLTVQTDTTQTRSVITMHLQIPLHAIVTGMCRVSTNLHVSLTMDEASCVGRMDNRSSLADQTSCGDWNLNLEGIITW